MQHTSRTQKTNIHARGVSAIELVFGVSIAALILVYVTYAMVLFVNSGRDVSDRAQGLYLAEEGLEMIRFIRDDDWSEIDSLTDNNDYYLDIDSASISITNTTEVIEGFERSFYVTPVYRNSNDDVVASTTPGATEDTGAKYVTVTVTGGRPERTATLRTILGNIEE